MRVQSKLSHKITSFFANYICNELGIRFHEENYFQLEKRLNDIAKKSGFNSVDDLYSHAKNGITGPLKNLILDTATNNETLFFRDLSIFKSIESLLRKDYFQLKNTKTLKVWSVPCSTGQEPYSLGILFDKLKFCLGGGWTIKASDISKRVLEIAKKGVYSSLEIKRGLDDQLLSHYFMKVDGTETWQIKSNISSRIIFDEFNLVGHWPSSIGQFDIVLLRNVLIYQEVETKKKVISQMTKHILPGGSLILGSAENLIGLSNDFESRKVENTLIYFKKK